MWLATGQGLTPSLTYPKYLLTPAYKRCENALGSPLGFVSCSLKRANFQLLSLRFTQAPVARGVWCWMCVLTQSLFVAGSQVIQTPLCLSDQLRDSESCMFLWFQIKPLFLLNYSSPHLRGIKVLALCFWHCKCTYILWLVLNWLVLKPLWAVTYPRSG